MAHRGAGLPPQEREAEDAMKITLKKFCDAITPADAETLEWWSSLPNHAVVTLKVEGGNRRSLDQNSLFQKWARQYAAHLTGIPENEIPDKVHEHMKYTLQRHCYAAMGWDFLLTEHEDLFTKKRRLDRRSTRDMDTGEMFAFMEWIQSRAADDGLILESLGEYAEHKQDAA